MTASSFRSRSCLSVEVYRPQIRLLHFCVDGRVGQRGKHSGAYKAIHEEIT
jgi:hypothetical protein